MLVPSSSARPKATTAITGPSTRPTPTSLRGTHPTSRNRTARIIRSCCVIAVSEPLTIIIATRRGSRTDPLAGDPWTDVVLGDKEMHWNPADP